MNIESLNTLEFYKVLEYLTEQIHSEITRELIQNTRPASEISAIEKRLTEVSEMRSLLDFDDSFPIEFFGDIRPALKKARLQGNFLEPVEFVTLKVLLKLARKIKIYLEDRESKYPVLSQLAGELAPLADIENKISQTIDEATSTVNDHASKKLASIRKEILTTQERIRKKIEAVQKRWATSGFLQETIITIREGRYVLLVKEQYRQRAKGLVHDQSASGATLFMEPFETIELSNHLRQLHLAEQREIERILIELTNLIREWQDPIETNLTTVVHFDYIHAGALFSIKINGCQPALNTENRLHLLAARHPLLVLKHNRRDDVIPITIEMGTRFSTLLISGANAGGKTVALKTVGLLALMTQSGLHIPAFPDSEMPIFDDIFAEIGDQQSIENDLSTFSSRIQKLKLILEQATFHTLVLMDEIGSGTDPAEGAALAAAILQKLTNIGCLTIATTHHGALKAFAFETKGIENGAMEFNRETLTPTYHFHLGVPGSSYAFEIAQRYGISTKLIESARTFVGADQQKVENLIIHLEDRYQKQAEIVRDLDRKQSNLDGLIKLYQEKIEEIKRDKHKLKKQAIEEAEQILSQVNTTVEQAIKQIREENASKAAIRAVKQRLDQVKASVQTEAKKIEMSPPTRQLEKIKPEHIEIGQTVWWNKFNTVASVLAPVDQAGKVLIEAGHLKMWVPLAELSSIGEQPEKMTPRNRGATIVRYEMPEHISTEIDLRGKRAEEAIDEVDKFIDKALIAGLHQIRILHGKGTGALKDTISEFLKKHPSISAQKEADWNEGAAGVTIAILKH